MANSLEKIGKYLDREVVPILRAQSVLRQLIPLNKKLSGKGIGMTAIETFNYAATGGASTDYEINENQADTMDVTDDILKIPIQQQEIKISARTFEVMQKNGSNIEADSIQEITSNVVAEQDINGIAGWKPNGTDVEIDGLYTVAANTYGGATFATYGNAVKAATNAKKELKADNVISSGYNMTLHGDQLAELDGSQSTAGIDEWDRVLRILNNGNKNGPGQILQSDDLTAGTGMVTPIASQENLRFFDLIEAQTPMNRVFIIGDTKTSPVHIRQVAALTQRFKHLDSSDNDPCVCTLTGI